jgi:hypothetical protein
MQPPEQALRSVKRAIETIPISPQLTTLEQGHDLLLLDRWKAVVVSHERRLEAGEASACRD